MAAAPDPPKRKRVLRKLKSKYRLLLINDRTFEERFSIRLSRLNVLLLAIAAAVFFVVVRPYNHWKERSATDADVEPTNEEKMVALLEEIARQPR